MQKIYRKNLKLRYGFISILFASFFTPSIACATISTWQGPYLGAYLGGGFGSNHTSTDAGSVSGTSYFSSTADINAVNSAGTSAKNPNTAIIGIQAGHDWVWKQTIYGIAADYGTLSLNSSKTTTNTYPSNSNQYSVYTSMSTNWLFTLRGRVGYPTTIHDWPSLFYLTGGMAMTQLKVNNNFSDNSSSAGAGGQSTFQNQIGWTVGAGLELISFGHASVDIQYLYIQMPSLKTTSSISNTVAGFGIPANSLSNPFSTTGKFSTNLLKIGLNYRFDE